jgi:glycosyltransferase involved in cell wall biosynthesis
MKVLCFIDTLGGGGAQRQMVTLAVTMAELGHQVEVLSYHPQDFFVPVLKQYGIQYKTITPYPFFRRFYLLFREFRRFNGDGVLAFLEGPALYAEILSLPRRTWGLVVSERSALHADVNRLSFRIFHHTADYVTSNSHKVEKALVKLYPKLVRKVRCIYNAVDLDHFMPCDEKVVDELAPIRLVSVANYSKNKNVSGITQALIRCGQMGLNFEFDWYGANEEQPECLKAREAIREAGMESFIRLHGPTHDAVAVYRRADALILGSFVEGLPNVVCEAMACGLPILMSEVSDARCLVEVGCNGYIFNPHQPEDIASHVMLFIELTGAKRAEMGRSSRQKAEALFNRYRNTQSYLDLLEESRRQHRSKQASK